MLESRVENYLRRKAEVAGALVRKLVTPGRRHSPDRLVLWPVTAHRFACADFVELKAPGKKPRAGQLREHKRLWRMGFAVRVIDTHEKVDRYIKERA